jgi:hypothetical protein
MTSNPSTEQTAQAKAAQAEGFLEGGMFVAGVAIGVAPAVAAAGIMLGSNILAIAVTGGLLVTGLLTAVLSSEL